MVVVLTVCSTRVSLHPSRQLHPIMGAVSLWTRPPALHLCAGPQKIYPTSQLSRSTAATCRCGTTATSTSRRNCSCDTSKTCRAQQRACQRRDRNCNCRNHSFLHPEHHQQGRRSPNVQQQNLCGLPNHRGPLRHDRGQLVQELDAEATSGSESTFSENPKP